jgi:hypothetical protein
MKKAIFFFACILSCCAKAQNTTSPYSILGIGDFETKDVGRYFITGNTAGSRRDAGSYNNVNPAALTALPYKLMHFDLAFRGRSSYYTLPVSGDRTDISKDFTIKRGSLAFKVTKNTGIAMGIQPFSTVNYQFSENRNISDGTDSYLKYTEGTGGINQLFVSAGRSIGKHFSAGITGAWLFGSIQRNSTYYSDALSLDVLKEVRDFYTGGHFKAGLQFYSDETSIRKWKHSIGLTGAVNTSLKGQLTSKYTENSTELLTNLESDRHFSLPLQAGLSYTATHKNKLSLSAEANYYYWKKQELNYKNSYTAPGFRLSAGMEYSFKQKTIQGLLEKTYLGWGVHAEETYMRINGQPLRDYAVSFGGGFSPARNISLYSGVELGIKGDKAGQYRENYTQFIFGVTVKDFWLGTKRFGRYN